MSRKNPYGLGEGELIGLDERPRPANMRARMRQGLRQSAPISSLQRRIIVFNLAGLALLVLGVFYLNQFRSGLIEQRVRGLQTLAEVISVTIAEDAGTVRGGDDYQAGRASRILARLVAPTGLRARLYDTGLNLIGDTRALLGDVTPDIGAPVPAIDEDGVVHRLVRWLESFYTASVPREDADTVADSPPTAPSYEDELRAALGGQITGGMRRNERDQLIVAVAHPVSDGARRFGVLLLSTEGEDINRIVRAERVAIVQVFILASLVSVGLSIVLANTIARPIKRLAAAASEGGDAGSARPLGPDRVQIPDMTSRSDEIGDLSSALMRMTDALYNRIEAIESFASDVAHEIKNPLTSLRSAVETMAYARTPEQRQRLLDVIQQDVGRMDRLVTDISNASRLDAELVRERMEAFDIGRLCEGLRGMFIDRAEERGVRLVLDLPQGPLMARGLEGRIGQVISNFLDNALSFSEPGDTVLLRAHRLKEGGVGVGVLDDGPGVPPENLESVFKRFYTERPESQGFGNHSGLGLAISRQIVEAHGGRIWVENRPGPDGPAGAHFRFELPE